MLQNSILQLMTFTTGALIYSKNGVGLIHQSGQYQLECSRCKTQLNMMGQDYRPLHNVCEFLHALHIYTDEARQGITRYVEAYHYCSHVRKDLRQCLIYDSNERDARLIGVEFMVPKHVYEKLDTEEQKLWYV